MTRNVWTGLGVALILAACASTPPPNAALESARAAVQTAESDPNVAQYDGADLEKAKSHLANAEAAAQRHDNAAAGQSAYLASQTARLAQLRASAKADDARVAEGQVERDKILLAERTREADKAKMDRDRLQSEVNALNAKPTDRGLVLTLGDVLFSTGKAELNPGGARNIEQLAQFLKEHAERRVEIDGYTDSIGSNSYNMDLSQRRANAVQAALVAQGIDGGRITTQGYGEEFPVASNSTSAGRQLNRRVEVIIGAENGAVIAARSS